MQRCWMSVECSMLFEKVSKNCLLTPAIQVDAEYMHLHTCDGSELSHAFGNMWWFWTHCIHINKQGNVVWSQLFLSLIITCLVLKVHTLSHGLTSPIHPPQSWNTATAGQTLQILIKLYILRLFIINQLPYQLQLTPMAHGVHALLGLHHQIGPHVQPGHHHIIIPTINTHNGRLQACRALSALRLVMDMMKTTFQALHSLHWSQLIYPNLKAVCQTI